MVGGSGPHEGNVIAMNNEKYKGPICDDGWGISQVSNTLHSAPLDRIVPFYERNCLKEKCKQNMWRLKESLVLYFILFSGLHCLSTEWRQGRILLNKSKCRDLDLLSNLLPGLHIFC